MAEVRRAVNTFYVLDGGYCVTEGIAKDKGNYFEAVLASDYDALATIAERVVEVGELNIKLRDAEQQVARLREAAHNLTCEVCKMDMQRALKEE